MNQVNYARLAAAQFAYEMQGFKVIEVPWRVSTPILNLTRPIGSVNKDYRIEGTDKAMIASGEQGFMYLMNKGFLPPGKYQTITPCFRNEVHDTIHFKQFMKLELIEVLEQECLATVEDASRMLEAARTVMAEMGKMRCGNSFQLEISKETKEQPLQVGDIPTFDLTLNVEGDQVELGSYGVRCSSFGTWVYGTGLAEPRFSRVLEAAWQAENGTGSPKG